MKTICAWCGKVIQDGPEEPVSHGVCEECSIKVMEPKREEDEALPSDFCELFAWGMKCMVITSLILSLLLGVVVLLVEALHILTGGWIPGIIKW